MLLSGGLSTPKREDESYLESELLELFPAASDGSSTRTQSFRDSDFQRISEVLKFTGKQYWSRIPRTYAVLRLIQELRCIDTFVAMGLSDINIPYTKDERGCSNLPSSLPGTAREKFLSAQNLVLTNIMDLERGAVGKHLHIRTKEDLQFKTRAILGRGGGCSMVEKVYSSLSLQEYALKLIRRTKTFKGDREALAKFEAELSIAKKISHHHIVKIVGSYTEPKYVGIIMGTIGDCNLGQFMKSFMDTDKKSLLRVFFGCLASALKAIHDAQIRHKDIKPENILIKDSIVYITDFGIALDWSEKTRDTTYDTPAMYTPRYCAKEVADWEPRNKSSDVWSLGAVYLEMASTLQDESLEVMRIFLDNNGAETSSQYCRNPEGVRQWIQYLRNKPGIYADKLPLAWISACMAEPHRERPEAHQLCDRIEEDTVQTDLPFFCSACIAILDPSESTISSPRFSPPMFPTQVTESSSNNISLEPVNTQIGQPQNKISRVRSAFDPGFLFEEEESGSTQHAITIGEAPQYSRTKSGLDFAPQDVEMVDEIVPSPQTGQDTPVESLTVYIGNTHHLSKPKDTHRANEHEWTFFVRPSRTDIIEEVHIHLHAKVLTGGSEVLEIISS